MVVPLGMKIIPLGYEDSITQNSKIMVVGLLMFRIIIVSKIITMIVPLVLVVVSPVTQNFKNLNF